MKQAMNDRVTDGPRPRRTARAIEMAGLDDGIVAVDPERLAELEDRVDGPFVRPGDEAWPSSIRLWNALAARVPALVVQPTSAADVAEAIRFARAHRLRLSIKGGGHNIAGSAIAERGLTLDMSRMRGVEVDPAARLARVGAGCLLGDVDRATQAHGLATVLGFFSPVGVAGLTLGGGLGYLTRRFGWTVDNLEEVEMVTADGVVRRASRQDNADLFWAVRGGGGNFGVVTRFTFRLHPVGPAVYGGLIGWPFERAAEILPGYRALTAAAPLELSAWLMLLRAPHAPFVPPDWQGRRMCAMSICYTGDLERVDEALAPVRAFGDPIFDLLHEQTYVEIQSYLDCTEPAGQHYYWKTEFAAELDDELLATWHELAAGCPIPEGQLGILHLGGTLGERDADDGAVGNRDARFALGALGSWAPDDPDEAAYRAWVADAWSRFRRFSTGGNYVNFQTADEDEDRVRASYGANHDLLAAIKAAHDPDNLFRANRNILPRRRG
ncbi:MAG TPA: FAD-binding oxidoreductase [Kofleriaceae bacterium]|nr:FAD-binding oxidoreductase [Kofleriaceae bacterium]